MAADQTKVDQLTAEDGKASGCKRAEMDRLLNLARAQLELDQDEVEYFTRFCWKSETGQIQDIRPDGEEQVLKNPFYTHHLTFKSR